MADRSAFAEELAHTIAALIARYHDANAEGGRDHRLIVAIHPTAQSELLEAKTKES